MPQITNYQNLFLFKAVNGDHNGANKLDSYSSAFGASLMNGTGDPNLIKLLTDLNRV